MKKFLSIAVFALSGLAFQAQAQHKHTEESKATPSAVKGQVYGENIEEKNARRRTAIAELEEQIKERKAAKARRESFK